MGNNRKYSNKNNHDRAGLKIQHSSLSGKTQVGGQQGLSFSEKLVWEFAAGTKCHKLSGFSDGHVLSRRSGGWKSEIEVSPGLVPGEADSGPGLSSRIGWVAGNLWRSSACGIITLTLP